MASLLIGIISGAIVFYGTGLMDKLRIDDPVGAFPVHGFNGMFGILAVGIWGVEGLGLLHGGGLIQLGYQLIGILACIAFVFPISFVLFRIIKRTIGLRVTPEVETSGIDLAFHGVGSYPEFVDTYTQAGD